MYSIFKNVEGEFVLSIDVQPSDPDGPMFIYDGGDTAALIRDWGSAIALKNLDEGIRPMLKELEEIRVVEVEGEDFIRDYVVPVRIVRNVKNMITI